MTNANSAPLLFAVCRHPGPIAVDELTHIAQFANLDIDRDIRVISLLEDNSPALVAELDLTRFGGVIISGSPLGYSKPAEQKPAEHLRLEAAGKTLMNRLVDLDHPTLAICYGLQSITLSRGGSLTGAYPEDLQAPDIYLTDAGLADPLTGQLPPHFRSFTGHSDAVETLPEGAVILARGDFCPIQMVRLGTHVYGTQFHPEITPEGMLIRIGQYGNQYYPADQKEAVTERCLSADVSGSNELITRFANRYIHA